MPDVNLHRLKDSMKRFMRLFLFSLEPFTKGTANTRADWIFDGSNPLFQFRRWRASSSAVGRLFVHGTSNGIARVYTSSTRYTKHLKRAKCCPRGVGVARTSTIFVPRLWGFTSYRLQYGGLPKLPDSPGCLRNRMSRSSGCPAQLDLRRLFERRITFSIRCRV